MREGLTDRIECRLGDGLEPIKSFEAESVLISGMGGPLMTEILENRIEEFSLAVLSPQSDFAKFRRFLFDRMEIVKEEYLEEGGKFYRLFLARKKQFPESQEIEQEEKKEERENEPKKKEDKKEFCRTAVEWEYGWLPLQEKDPVLKRMLEKEEKQYKEILEKKQIKEVKEKLELVNKALLYYRTPRNKT